MQAQPGAVGAVQLDLQAAALLGRSGDGGTSTKPREQDPASRGALTFVDLFFEVIASQA